VAGVRHPRARIRGIDFQKRGIPILARANRLHANGTNNQSHNRKRWQLIEPDACIATTNTLEIGFQLPLLGNVF
jgi:hypothetical protein